MLVGEVMITFSNGDYMPGDIGGPWESGMSAQIAPGWGNLGPNGM